MSKTLVMNFLNGNGEKASIRLSDVKDGVTDVEVKAAMDIIIAQNIFESKGADLVQKDSARIVDTATTELF
ncbi:DUF2922 domain-containing protein [Clostridium tyrobutyricum]|uniref:DUF2922 domain-containing protein n=1 Tax=Clostridium tyrobutyricum TaxID=1519 RepID=UPI0018A9CCE8|nr:DUF2922 domain-containing protein [Clostridium tyrobutyricum]